MCFVFQHLFRVTGWQCSNSRPFYSHREVYWERLSNSHFPYSKPSHLSLRAPPHSPHTLTHTRTYLACVAGARRGRGIGEIRPALHIPYCYHRPPKLSRNTSNRMWWKKKFQNGKSVLLYFCSITGITWNRATHRSNYLIQSTLS